MLFFCMELFFPVDDEVQVSVVVYVTLNPNFIIRAWEETNLGFLDQFKLFFELLDCISGNFL